MAMYVYPSGVETPIKNMYIGEYIAPRSPWANTIAYYPLDSTNTVNDLSWNNQTLSNSGVVFWTYNWVDCAYCNKKTVYRQITNMPIGWTSRTISIWVYDTEYTSNWQAIWWQWGSGSHFVLFQKWSSEPSPETNGTQLSTPNGSVNANEPFVLNVRTLMTCTYDGSTLMLYKNGVQYWNTATPTLNTGSWNFYISWWRSVGNETFSGYLSNCIIENVAWTQQEVQDYFNSTKANYWIS